jgi:uncharacterized protein YrzB (UPF0473 family)
MSEDKEKLDCSCDDGCDCGGCHDEDVMTLTLEDGTEIECAVIAVFPVEDKDYIALLPLENQDEGEVFLYGYEEFEDGTFELLSIESDEDYEAVANAFDEILDAAEMEELLDDEE